MQDHKKNLRTKVSKNMLTRYQGNKKRMKQKHTLKLKKLDCIQIYADAIDYDEDHGDIDWDIPFYMEEAKRACGEVLEIACGTGRLTLPLAKAGIKITGLDVSAPMIKRAKEKAREEDLTIDWLLSDCRKFKIQKRFNLVFAALNSMQHLHDLESIDAFDLPGQT